MIKKKILESEESGNVGFGTTSPSITIKVQSEKEKLLELYETLKALNVRSISDLENLIAKA